MCQHGAPKLSYLPRAKVLCPNIPNSISKRLAMHAYNRTADGPRHAHACTHARMHKPTHASGRSQRPNRICYCQGLFHGCAPRGMALCPATMPLHSSQQGCGCWCPKGAHTVMRGQAGCGVGVPQLMQQAHSRRCWPVCRKQCSRGVSVGLGSLGDTAAAGGCRSSQSIVQVCLACA